MTPVGRWRFAICLAVVFGVLANSAMAELFRATPSDYREKLRELGPGDTLVLTPGVYRDGLPLHDIEGRPGAPITIEGDASGVGTVLVARSNANTISIRNAAYLVIRSLTLDGAGQLVDAVKAEGTSKFAHHITLEDLAIVNHGADQQLVGISTKCPAWDWVIRDNEIRGAGTGMYLGNSDGNAPFVAGLIEGNLIVDTIGYNLQIKHQISRPDLPGMPVSPSRTVIRDNVFSKANGGSSGKLARPNVLLGHLPEAGQGSDDTYDVYGNFFYENPTESLFQAEGNVTVHDNVFINSHSDGLRIQPHHSLPRRVEISHNTVLARSLGIAVAGGDTRFQQRIVGNAVFAGTPLRGGEQRANVVGSYGAVADFLIAPLAVPGEIDMSPLGDKLDLPSRIGQVMPDAGSRDFYGRCRKRPVAGAILSGQSAPWPIDLSKRPRSHSLNEHCMGLSAGTRLKSR